MTNHDQLYNNDSDNDHEQDHDHDSDTGHDREMYIDKDNDNDKNNNNAASQFGDFDELLSMGGSFKPIQEFDNNKELKDFIKMFKKQNRKSYKSKNSSTRRNKKNNK